MTPLELTGKVDTHIAQYGLPPFSAEMETAHAFLKMKAQAEKEGFQLYPVSAFRDFNSQLMIWNEKFRGERPLYDQSGNRLDPATLTTKEKILSILNWSALPGGSRHHWGTEIDLIDEASIPEGYQVQLLPAEFDQGGVFYRLNTWLSENMQTFGFFRPYREYKGGVNREPWHLSYEKVSRKALEDFTCPLLHTALENSDILGQEMILQMLPQIYEQYILNISAPTSSS